MSSSKRVPKRPFRDSSVSIVGLGCSSFSTFFWTDKELATHGDPQFDIVNRNNNNNTSLKSHPRVREWIRTVHYAVQEAGITLLDTAPWYGHGSSEIVLGWALEELFLSSSARRQQPQDEQKKQSWPHIPTRIRREDLIINTKVGRYEADPAKQFDYSREMTLFSVKRSLDRLKCDYIDVLQLHDAEFVPTLHVLLNETIPAMLDAKAKGWCRAIGLTGYPLAVQHQILECSFEKFGENVWDQALTYCHYNLHDASLFSEKCYLTSSSSLSDQSLISFADYCFSHNIAMIAAAPLSMGLLTRRGPPTWHPASDELQQACRQAATICEKSQEVNDISKLALLYALSQPRIPCTILGIKDTAELKVLQELACRFDGMKDETLSQQDILEMVLTDQERALLKRLQDPVAGPFASVWKNGTYEWDGVQGARDFWKQEQVNHVESENWQDTKQLP